MYRLTHAREALDWAMREFDTLRHMPAAGPQFADRLPYVIDRAVEVTRQIDKTAAQLGRKNDGSAFSLWWKELDKRDKFIRGYRNELMKGNEADNKPGWVQRTRIEVTMSFPPDAAVIVADMWAVTADGEQVFPREIVTLPDHGQAVWYFRGQQWDGQPVIEALAQRLAQLGDVIIPEAEQLLS
jgi:hypothetical protein